VVSNPVRLEEGANRRLVLSTPYHKDFVEALKETIPSAYRRWEDETKTWNIAQEYRVSLLRLLNRYFGAVGESDSLSLIGQDLAEGNLVVLDLSGIAGETDRDLVATLITRRQFEYNLERSDLSESSEKGGLVPFVAFFEEAQNLLSTDKMQAGRDPTFVRLFKEGRGLSIGTTSITQQPGALARSLTSQIAYYVVQHLRSSEDIQNLTEMDGALEGTERDIARRIPGNALMVDNERGFALPLKVDRFDREYVEAVKLAYPELEAEEQKPSTNIGLSGY
jgi:DNA helicase HerA-like ATPase